MKNEFNGGRKKTAKFDMTLHFERGSDGLKGFISFKSVFAHWAFIGISLLMVGIVLLYAFVENFGSFLGVHQLLEIKSVWTV